MLVKKKKTIKRYSGKGLFDSIFSGITNALTSNVAKEVATNLSKTAATKLGEKAIQKVTDKIFPPKQEISPRTRMLVEAITSKGRGIKRI